MVNIVLFGAPGCGKGTQAVMYCKSKSMAHISTGEMLRAAVSSGSALGMRMKEIMDAGQLVPDGLMIELIEQRIGQDDCRNGYVLDGFPRTEVQAEALSDLLSKRNETLSKVVLFELSEEEVARRLSYRRGVESRSDDSAETQRERLRVYQEQTAPLIDYYRKLGALIVVDATGTIEEVQAKLLRALGD